jgi:hypothetical protein
VARLHDGGAVAPRTRRALGDSGSLRSFRSGGWCGLGPLVAEGGWIRGAGVSSTAAGRASGGASLEEDTWERDGQGNSASGRGALGLGQGPCRAHLLAPDLVVPATMGDVGHRSYSALYRRGDSRHPSVAWRAESGRRGGAPGRWESLWLAGVPVA